MSDRVYAPTSSRITNAVGVLASIVKDTPEGVEALEVLKRELGLASAKPSGPAATRILDKHDQARLDAGLGVR